MTDSKHTSEPWTVVKAKRPDNTGGYDYAIADSDDNIIAEVFQNVGYADKEKKIYNQRPAKANAHLIATSPELLEACQAGIIYSKAIESCANDPEKMASFCTAEGDTLDELYFNWINRCDKAIAQAEGK